MAIVTVREALRQAMDEEMDRDEDIIVWTEAGD
jgi:pyruvate/2-oxoglutarate/acetoin dehydrogenase E1 component